MVFFSSSIIKNFHWPSSVALLYSIGCLLNDMFVFDLFIWQPMKSRMWMSGVGTLCAYARYRASLFVFNVKWYFCNNSRLQKISKRMKRSKKMDAFSISCYSNQLTPVQKIGTYYTLVAKLEKNISSFSLIWTFEPNLKPVCKILSFWDICKKKTSCKRFDHSCTRREKWGLLHLLFVSCSLGYCKTPKN